MPTKVILHRLTEGWTRGWSEFKATSKGSGRVMRQEVMTSGPHWGGGEAGQGRRCLCGGKPVGLGEGLAMGCGSS